MFGRVLSLFDESGMWSQPYAETGSVVTRVDLSRGEDVRILPFPVESSDVVLAAPPCQHFAASGASHWRRKGNDALFEGLALVDATMRIIAMHRPAVWAIENPVGRLTDYLGPPRFMFDPWEYAGWADDPEADRYTKRTCLWGDFIIPEKKPLVPTEDGKKKIVNMPDSASRRRLRSITPQGFARAFAAANPPIGRA